MHNTGIFANLRRKIDLKLKGIENKDRKYKAFVYALLFGDRSLLDWGQLSLFKETGTMHLFAVSGLHIGIVYLIFSYILKRIFRKDRFGSLDHYFWFSDRRTRRLCFFRMQSIRYDCNVANFIASA